MRTAAIWPAPFAGAPMAAQLGDWRLAALMFALWAVLAALLWSSDRRLLWRVALPLAAGMVGARMASERAPGYFAAGTALLLAAAAAIAALSSPRWRWLALATLVWMVVFFSGGRGGPDPMLEWALRLGLTPVQAEAVVIVVRKSVHFCFYGCVAWAAWGAAGGAPAARARFALRAALALALFDETRQTLHAERTGSALDVLIDLAGAMVALWLLKRKAHKAESGHETVL